MLQNLYFYIYVCVIYYIFIFYYIYFLYINFRVQLESHYNQVLSTDIQTIN